MINIIITALQQIRYIEIQYIRLVFTSNYSKGLTKELISQVSASLRKIGCRCVLDDVKSRVIFKPGFHTGFFAGGGGEVIVKVVVVYVSY